MPGFDMRELLRAALLTLMGAFLFTMEARWLRVIGAWIVITTPVATLWIVMKG